MSDDLIPAEVMKYFVADSKIGRNELAKKADISISDARFYCRLFKEKTTRKTKIIERGIAAFDIHHPFHDVVSFNCLLEAIKIIKPTIFILGGDQLDMNTISTFNRHKPKLIENSRIKNDYKSFDRDILIPLKKVLSKDCKKYWLNGNHEHRVDRLIESEPKLEGLIEIRENLDLDGWVFKKYKEILSIGHMHFTHGIYTTKYHAEKNVSIYQKNIFSGHCHTSQEYTSISPVSSLPKQGVSVGCLCNRNPEYNMNSPNRWVNQFLIFYILNDGTFRFDKITIIFGKCIVNGVVIDGNKD